MTDEFIIIICFQRSKFAFIFWSNFILALNLTKIIIINQIFQRYWDRRLLIIAKQLGSRSNTIVKKCSYVYKMYRFGNLYML